MSKKGQAEKPKLLGARVFDAQRIKVKKLSKKLRVSQSQVVRSSIDNYNPLNE